MSLTKIRDLRPHIWHVQVEGQVQKKEVAVSSTTPLAKALISDETGEITTNLRRDQIEQVKVGDKIRIVDSFVKTWAGKPVSSTCANIETTIRKEVR